ncbi:MAG: HD-GYP domain-containing protein [Deltaproteobacteria bacterium]|nr:HD-GYP domain-containing protein [Deltaproteobacteria bacterium]
MERPSPPGNQKDISSEWLQLLVDSALDGIVTMDAYGRIIAFNPAAEKIFGYSKKQVIGQRVSEKLIPKELRLAHEKGLAQYLATGKSKIIGNRIELEAMRSGGGIFPAEVEVISVKSSKEPIFIAYIRDISERKERAREQLHYAENIKATLLQTLLAVSKTVEIRDPYTAGHQRRVAHLAASIAQQMGLSDEEIEGIFLGALIHDIGKIAVPAEILSRPGKLRDEDIDYLKIHCQKGYEILKPVDFPWPIAKIALQHHEHLNGTGYPQGLRKGEILLEARIVCVADVVDAMTSHRPYRPAISLEEALSSLLVKAGKWYDAHIVEACVELFREGYRIDAVDLEELAWLVSLK